MLKSITIQTEKNNYTIQQFVTDIFVISALTYMKKITSSEYKISNGAKNKYINGKYR